MKKKSDYYEKLKDPRWQKKRLEIFERDGWECKYCHRKTETLHVHHIFYLPKTEPWDVPNGLLVTLCEDCHKPGPWNRVCGGVRPHDNRSLRSLPVQGFP